MALSVYYKLVIVDGWKESAFSSWLRVALLGTPTAVGLGFSFAGLPYYGFLPTGCGIPNMPWHEHKVHYLAILLIPGLIVFVAVTGVTIYAFYCFRKQVSTVG